MTSKLFKELINQKGCIIIAEACENHFGSLENAKKMVLIAKESGADVIKFQHHIPDEEMLPNVPRSENFVDDSLYDFLKKNSLGIEDHKELIAYCQENNILYLCTPFSMAAADQLINVGQNIFKIGSGEFRDKLYLDSLSKKVRSIVISSGMCTKEEVRETVSYLANIFEEVYLLNCTSEYPPKYKDLNLMFIKSLIDLNISNVIIGHSDHTTSLETSFASIALGAKIIEKHFYLNDEIKGPDYPVSLSPSQLKELCLGRDRLMEAMGNNKKVNDDEKVIRSWAYRSIVAKNDLCEGDVLTIENIASKRPGNGIPSWEYENLIGKKLIKDCPKDSVITYRDFK